MSERAYRVGVTGHRVLGSAALEESVREQCLEVLARAKEEHERVVAVSAIAIGADSIFAGVAMELGIPLHVVVPFETYEQDFETEAERAHYEDLLARAMKVRRLRYKRRSDKAYFAGGTWIAERVNLLVAVWDEKPARGLGGTGDVVAHAMERGTMVHVIKVKRPA